MDLGQWTNVTEISSTLPTGREDSPDLVFGDRNVSESSALLDTMSTGEGYGTDEYCQDIDNLGFGGLDEYFFTPTKNDSTDGSQVAPATKMFPKKEARPSKHLYMDSQALPVMPNVKSEYANPHQYQCCVMPVVAGASFTRTMVRSGELSLDTAFSPTSDLGSSCSASPAVDLDSPDCVGCGNDTGFEVYHDLIMRHLIQDIQGTCARLNLPRDPKLWTPRDSNAWLMDMSAQYHLSQVPYDKLSVDGATLCSMSLGQFAQCFPNGGETVHAQLQIWNSANEYCLRQSSSTGSNPVMVSVNNDEQPGLGMHDEQQFVQMNPGSVIQRLRSVVDEGPSGYVYPSPFLLPPQQQDQFGTQMPPPGTYGMGAILPSPGSCSDSGLSVEGEYGSMNLPSGSLDSGGRSVSTGNGSNIHLWQFLRELLEQQEKYGQCVRWIDHNAGIFKIEDSHALARLWGKRKNRPAMNYDKLSRSLRQYYKKNILKKTTRSQRLVYQFLHPYHVC